MNDRAIIADLILQLSNLKAYIAQREHDWDAMQVLHRDMLDWVRQERDDALALLADVAQAEHAEAYYAANPNA